MNLGTYNSNIWMHRNTSTQDLTFGFVFSIDNSPDSFNLATLNFRIVSSTTNPFVSQSDDPGEAVETPAGSDAFVGNFRYGFNTDGIAVSGIAGGTWTIIIDSVNFGDVTNWYAAGGGSSNGSSCLTNLPDLGLTIGNEYRLTPAGNPPSGAPVDATVLYADAGSVQTVDENTAVQLDGSASTPAGEIDFQWMQIAGPAVVLNGATSVSPTFTAPEVAGNQTLTFQLIVTKGAIVSDPDTVDITVRDVNQAPVADAGDDQSVREGAPVQLSGLASYDPDGDALVDFDWVQSGGVAVTLNAAQTAQPSFTAPLGIGSVLDFQLLVSDGSLTSAPDVVSVTVTENNAPVADAGLDDTVDEAPGLTIALSGAGSSDPDGDSLSFAWTQLSGPAVALQDGMTATPSFAQGPVAAGGVDYVFELEVTDDYAPNPKSATDLVAIHVRNINDPPTCELAVPTVASFWPPNHKMVRVGIDNVNDADSSYNNVVVIVTGVTQDEPTNGLGDGDTSPDASVLVASPNDSVLLRAERSGNGNGRVYVINFGASDGFESCTGTVSVSVPHSRKDTAVDDGQNYQSADE